MVRTVLLSIVFAVLGCSFQEEAPKASQVGNLKAMETKPQVPIHPWHKERVENIGSETIEQVIENLANFDDNHFAQTADSGGYVPGEPKDEMMRIVHLSRVGRLVAEGRNDPDSVVPLLRENLVQSLEDWPEALEARQEKWLTEGNFSLDGPEEYEKTSTRGLVTTYVLAELGDYESLPVLLHSYKKSEQWIAKYKPYPADQFFVPPTITLYSMHRLVDCYPADKLNPDAIDARDEYLKWADENLPEAKTVSRSTWYAEYDTSDPMVKVMDPECILHKVQRKINLTVYPHKYNNGTWFEGYIEVHVDEKTQEWFDTMEPFLKAVVSDKPMSESDS